MKKTNDSKSRKSPAQLIDATIKELGDWRGETLSTIGRLIKQADPKVVEEWNARCLTLRCSRLGRNPGPWRGDESFRTSPSGSGRSTSSGNRHGPRDL